MEEQHQNLSSLILETLRAKSITLEKLSQMTGIPERFLNLLLEERFDRLPAAPYIRGYLIKIAEALHLDGNRLWSEYLKDNALVRRSGQKDELPPNRFAAPSLDKKMIAVIGIIVVGVLVVALRLPAILGIPELSLELEDNLITTSSIITLSGTAEPRDQLTINGEPIYPDPNGAFQRTMTLQPGFNTFTFVAKRFLGRERTVVKQIFYREAATSSTNSPLHGTEQ